MNKTIIHTVLAPKAVGPYSQAVKTGSHVYLSGQLGISLSSGELLACFEAQAHQVFQNLRAVCQAAGGELSDIAKLTVFLTDMAHFARLNDIMRKYFSEPFPARSAVQVAALPRGGEVEAEAILVRA